MSSRNEFTCVPICKPSSKPYLNGFKMQADVQPHSFLRRYNDVEECSEVAQNKSLPKAVALSGSSAELLNQNECGNQAAANTRRTYFLDSSDEEGHDVTH